jgi:outer membrane receptor for ferrienterochelin and colicins
VDFTDRVILDLENPREARVYNAESSVSTSAQAEFWWDIHRRLSIRLAYRMIETETAFAQDGLSEVTLLSDPFVSKHRGFANFAYASRVAEDGSGWKADLTVQWVGEQRLPSTLANPEEHQRPDVGEAYFLAGGQVTKMFSKALEIYVGSENLTGYRQDRPIIAEDDPFGEYFDASLVYAPVFGRNLYAGLRWTLDN